jgi:hypothetical protein
MSFFENGDKDKGEFEKWAKALALNGDTAIQGSAKGTGRPISSG